MPDDSTETHGTGDGSDDGDERLAARTERLHEALRATEERPLERDASRWIGEAQAVAGDAADLAASDGAEAVVRERVGHVADLLGHVDSTRDEAADERVAAARTIAGEIAHDGGGD